MLAFACTKNPAPAELPKDMQLHCRCLLRTLQRAAKCYGKSARLPSQHTPSPVGTLEHACCTVAEQNMLCSYSARCSRSAGHSPKAHPAGSLPLHCFSMTTCSTPLIKVNINPDAAAATENSVNPVCKGARVFPNHLAS